MNPVVRALFLVVPLIAACIARADVMDDAIASARTACAAGRADAGLEQLRRGALRESASAGAYALPDAYLVEAECLLAKQLDRQALDALGRALVASRRAADREVEQAALRRLGQLNLQLGNPAEARVYLEQLVGRSPAERAAARPADLIALGAAYALNDQFREASQFFEAAIGAAERAGDARATVAARLQLARADLDGGDPRAAAVRLGGVEASILADADEPWQAAQLIALGELLQRIDRALGEQGRAAAATRALARARDIAARSADPRAESLALGYLGSVAEQLGHYQQALAFTREAILRAEQAAAPDALYQWHWQSGRILAASGQVEAAIQAYQQSVGVLDTIRPELARGSPAAFQRTVAPVFFGLADLLLGESDSTGAPAAVQARLRLARDTIEQLKTVEIQNYFDNQCVVTEEKSAELDQLAASAAIIYPVIFDDRLEVLVSSPSGIRRHTARVGRAELTDTVLEFRRALEKRPRHDYRAAGQRLHQWLVAPELADLKREGIGTLVFVPDGPLRTIPPAALYDGSRFLVEDFATATTLGLTLTSPRTLRDANVRVLTAGLTVARSGFRALPAVGPELDEIRALYPVEEFRDGTFLLQPVSEQLSRGRYSIVHIATHGEFSPDYRKSFLLAYDQPMTLDVLEGSIGLRRYLNEPVEMLVLSACETAAGDDRAALGLAGIALKAGARSAVASLWAANDDATSLLIGRFYEGLKDASLSRAEALRQAQLELLADRRYAHPALWSPFLMIGNWL